MCTSNFFAHTILPTPSQKLNSVENFKLVFKTRVAYNDQFFQTDFISDFRLNIYNTGYLYINNKLRMM